MGDAPPNPRAWLFRVASNLWFDQLRRRRREEPLGERDEGGSAPDPLIAREAAGTLLGQLSPQERAAVVLKDAFELSLEEIAEALSTTTGAVKSALHRGRGKLVEPDPEHVRDGMKVRLATYPIGTDSEGTEAIGFGFEPVF